MHYNNRDMNPWDQFTGANAGYVLELFERFQRDAASVDDATRAAFRHWTPPPQDPAAASTPSAGTANVTVALAAVALAEAIRRYGHLAARLDPIGFHTPVGDPSLHPQSHGLTTDVLRRLPAAIIGGPVAEGAANAHEAIERLRSIYCATSGHDFAQVFVPDERVWLRQSVEARRYRPPADPIDGRELLDRITRVEAFERFLHRTFPGKTRFSIEGLDLMVPILDEIIADAAASGVKHVLIAMAHRGRLNVLAHVLQKPYAQILAEFKDPLFARSGRIELGWMGDVKYHAGARLVRADVPSSLVISMPPNPSHLEAVDPVLVGMARAAATRVDAPGAPRLHSREVLGILIHGDAAFPGQGVVAETLNLSRLAGWDVGGTIHLIANNQLGFTADPHEAFSTSYASGLARGFKVPIVHVNADDAEGCIEAARLAWAYRERFALDFLIDLVGYRRYGHNEGDEPAFTQPQLYQKVAQHPTARQQYATSLVATGQVPPLLADELVAKHAAVLEKTYAELKPEQDYVLDVPVVPPSGAAAKVRTAVPLERLTALNTSLATLPRGFTIHKKLERGRERRGTMLAAPDERTVDWAAAEELALASILADAIPVRFTGEDVERGTFSHRHAVLHDTVTGDRHVPLQALPQATAAFEIHNSALSELAVLGFELGYNLQEPARLVLWEAQYRGLHQRRADHPRRVPDVGPCQVGHGAVAGAAPAPRLRGPGTGSLQRPARALPAVGRRPQRAHRQLHDRRPVFSRAAPPGAAPRHRSTAVGDADAEEPAAPSHGGLDAARAGRGRVPEGHRRRAGGEGRGQGATRGAVQRQSLRGSRLERAAAGIAARRAGARRADLPFPCRGAEGALRPLLAAARGLLGAGRAREHGRVGVRTAAARTRGRRPMAVALRRPGAELQPVGRVGGVAPAQPACGRRPGVRGHGRGEGAGSGAFETGVRTPEQRLAARG